jgi:probable addiction module antidote protein
LARKGLYKVLSSGGNPEFATVMKVITALGLKLGVHSAQV